VERRVSDNIGEDPVQAAKRQIEEVTPEQVLEMQAKNENIVYLDVREPKEWNLGRIPRAIHIPLGNLENKVGDLIPRDQRVVIYCARGNRSALAALAMKRMGYDKVASMARGITGWADINGEIEE
jgi:sulfur-carrier protein adenylyltransferase/sulfurtransferase